MVNSSTFWNNNTPETTFEPFLSESVQKIPENAEWDLRVAAERKIFTELTQKFHMANAFCMTLVWVNDDRALISVYRVLAFATFHYWSGGKIANFPLCNQMTRESSAFPAELSSRCAELHIYGCYWKQRLGRALAGMKWSPSLPAQIQFKAHKSRARPSLSNIKTKINTAFISIHLMGAGVAICNSNVGGFRYFRYTKTAWYCKLVYSFNSLSLKVFFSLLHFF